LKTWVDFIMDQLKENIDKKCTIIIYFEYFFIIETNLLLLDLPQSGKK